MAETYGCRRRWRTFDGSRYGFETKGHASRQEAELALMEHLLKAGWTPPRWWQFWRWGENA